MAGEYPPFFILKKQVRSGSMKELSIFIDESGDFGEYDYHSTWYIVTMVFHFVKESIISVRMLYHMLLVRPPTH